VKVSFGNSTLAATSAMFRSGAGARYCYALGVVFAGSVQDVLDCILNIIWRVGEGCYVLASIRGL
jgi:hypothetical protein